jgi:hypothetical protein
MIKLWLALFLLTLTTYTYAAGTIIVVAIAGSAFAATATGIAIAMAINMVVALVVSKAFNNQPSFDFGDSGSSPNPGNRQQVPPATDNKLPVVYGTAFVGGTITDLSISSNNQELYYVLSICEVTNTNLGQQADNIDFGDVYYGGKKVIFADATSPDVTGLLDESTGLTDTTVAGKIQIFMYRNGSNAPARGTQSAIEVMQTSGLVYTWDASKLMTNCAFAILHLSYSQTANIRGIETTKFQVTNSRTDTGSCFSDYFTNTRYGCAINSTQIDSASLNELTTYSNGSFAYTSSTGAALTQPRFKFNGTLDTNRTVMQNLQDMASCCDCLIKYNEITAQWGVIVQSPIYVPVMDINDSNMISAIQITPLDIASSYNVIEAKFPDVSNQDAFNSSTFDLASIAPNLLYPNEPVNKMSVSLPLTNNSITAQYLANRMLKGGREDLQVQVSVNFVGVQLDAGDIVTVTNANYGWVAKPFRINKVVQQFNDDGAIAVQLNISEYNASVYDDVSITQFQPAPNTGIGDPLFFGTIPAPILESTITSGANPIVVLEIVSASSGISQYAELWYSAFSNPTESQRIFAGITAVQSAGNPYQPNSSMGNVIVNNLPLGNWYFFSRMVNSLGSSNFSPASALITWRPTTIQYTQRYLVVAYADDLIGTGFTTNPRNKAFYGLVNAISSTPILTPASYTWFAADPTFATDNYLLFINYGTRKFGFDSGQADYAAVTGSFVPTNTDNFDRSIWSGLPDGTNFIDLDRRTGQITQTGTTTVGTGEILVSNNADGVVVASLSPLLNFGGAGTFTAAVANLTIDIYGRVLGFEPPDDFGYTMQQFSATAGQTVFSVTRNSGYRVNNCWVFQNGCWLEPSEFTDTAGSTGTVTLDVGANVFDIITIVSFRSFNPLTSVTYDSFTVNTVNLTNANSYTASGFILNTGYELLFLNGTILSDQDYDIVGQTITNFPSQVTGNLSILQWTQNNLTVPNGTPINVVTNSVIGQDTYPFSYIANALNIYQNGILLDDGTDYTAGFGDYVLANTPTDVNQILLQQTFNRTGSA